MSELTKTIPRNRVGRQPQDLTGKRFGLLTILGDAPKSASGQRRLFARCDCGVEKTVVAGDVRSGDTKSCGCMSKKWLSESKRTHGLSRSPEHIAWNSMWQRCTNPGQDSYPIYGGKGIKVCERWRKVENFFADMGRKPTPRHQLDRFPNRHGDYEPGNVRWATPSENSRNRDSNVLWEHEGKMIHQIDMAKIVAEQRGIKLKSADCYLRAKRLSEKAKQASV